MVAKVRLTRTVQVPDAVCVARCQKLPELGPRLLFFSGGTALRDLSRRLVHYTHNSIHLITPFDSGGSSAELRRAFGMLAVGDLRNRVMALADQSVQGQPEVYALFSFRFPKDREEAELKAWLGRMIEGGDPLVEAIPDPLRKIVRSHLRFFEERMPEGFSLRGANIGNLILAGGYLTQGRHIDPVIFLFSRLVEARGTVRPVASEDLQLAAELEDGTVVLGQHLLTGKEASPIASPVRRLFLSESQQEVKPATLVARDKVCDLVRGADLICYPIGSFYSSLVASLLPQGLAKVIAETDVPKVYVPNRGRDPEQLGMGLARSVAVLLDYLRQGSATPTRPSDLLHLVLVDRSTGEYDDAEVAATEELGVEVVDVGLVTERSTPLIDAERLAQVLVSLA